MLHLLGYSRVWGTVVMAKSVASCMGLVKRDGDCWVAAIVTFFLNCLFSLQPKRE